MSNFSENSKPPFALSAPPKYQDLHGQSFQQTVNLLQRKGGLQEPRLSRDEAMQIAGLMRLEHFPDDAIISFEAQSNEQGRLMLILAGEVNIRLREAGLSRSQYSPVDQHERWATATEGATLGLVHAFAGLSSRFYAQVTAELFVASLSREALMAMKQQKPELALRVMEMLAMELAFVALDHERSLQAMNNVARSMQNMIDGEASATRPAALF
jgi:CRP-like cAMP-binding protein